MGIEWDLPLYKEFYFKREADGYGGYDLVRCNAEEKEGFIGFRAYTNGDDHQVTQMISKRKFRINQEEGTLDEEAEINNMSIAYLQIRLTLGGTDFKKKGSPALEFVTNDGVTTIKDILAYDKWWKELPPHWAVELYRACLEVNPGWARKRSDVF